jgi:single-stranded-DNA-specific exonuclease
MKYKIINEELANQRDILSIEEIVLRNRGIEEPNKYLNLNYKALNSYNLLNNIDKAKDRIIQAMETNQNIVIVVDTDVDGFCSASILYKYLENLYGKRRMNFALHTGKQHGLSKDITIPDGTDLVILPDGGTNDVTECKELFDRGIDIVILDHHQSDINNSYAIIVNPMLDNYPNKNASGTLVVYKLLENIDDDLWLTESDKFQDLVALSILADSMSILEFENKYIVNQGLSKIKNKLFKALIEKQSYSMNGDCSQMNISFYIIPLINALIRSGSQDEKQLLFQAFIESDEYFPYKKRGETEEVQEDIYSRVARLASNAKARQNREIDKGLEIIKKEIYAHNWHENKLLFVNGTGLDSNFGGLVAMKLASEFSKPCILLKENSWKPGTFGGSARNFDGSPIGDLKTFLQDTKMFNFCQGHMGAFGLEINQDKIKKTIAYTNELLKDIDFDKIYKVDFVFSPDEINVYTIKQLDQLKNFFGAGINECLIVIEDIKVNTKDIEIIGANKDTWKIVLNDELILIKFKCQNNDKLIETINNEWGGELINLTIVGKSSINLYNGIVNYQIVVIDYNFK